MKATRRRNGSRFVEGSLKQSYTLLQYKKVRKKNMGKLKKKNGTRTYEHTANLSLYWGVNSYVS